MLLNFTFYLNITRRVPFFSFWNYICLMSIERVNYFYLYILFTIHCRRMMVRVDNNEIKKPKRVKYQGFFPLQFLKWDNINGRIFIYLQNLFFPISSYKNYTFESEHKKFDLKWVFNLIFFWVLRNVVEFFVLSRYYLFFLLLLELLVWKMILMSNFS